MLQRMLGQLFSDAKLNCPFSDEAELMRVKLSELINKSRLAVEEDRELFGIILEAVYPDRTAASRLGCEKTWLAPTQALLNRPDPRRFSCGFENESAQLFQPPSNGLRISIDGRLRCLFHVWGRGIGHLCSNLTLAKGIKPSVKSLWLPSSRYLTGRILWASAKARLNASALP